MEWSLDKNVYTDPWTHSAFNGDRITLGGKAAGRGVNHPPAYRAKVKESVELYCYYASVFTCYVIG